MKSFLKSARMLIKTTHRLEQNVEHIEKLKSNIIPAGCAPFKLAFTTPELDTRVSADMLNQDFHIPEGSTFREAKELLHIWKLRADKQLDVAMMKTRVAELKVLTRMDSFIDGCTHESSKIADR
eukprot:5549920-Lingulodinium_polyedra.AAC.1